MRLTPLLLEALRSDFQAISFTVGTAFHWSPTERRITYDVADDNGAALLLHEVAHAELEHTSYYRDIQLLGIERAAWNYATATLAPRYNVEVSTDLIEDHLDSYRDWLHARSTCPSCKETGLQRNNGYFCPLCLQRWQPNAAISTQLRRYKKHLV